MDIALSNELLNILFEFLPQNIQEKIIAQSKEKPRIIEKTIKSKEGKDVVIKSKTKTDRYELIRYYLGYGLRLL